MRALRFFSTTCVMAMAVAAIPANAGEIGGTVVDSSGTIALQAAQVRIVELDRTENAARDGRFHFSNVPEGTYTLEVRYIGAETMRETVTVSATGSSEVSFSLGAAAGGGILVIGQAANQASALSRKRASDTVSDVLTRDAIGQFPDQNVAESLRRLPGINILNDQGEGRFVSIRGLDPELNATSLNGVRVPAPESDVRSVALDVISSDIVESIEVKKSLTPDMDADTIGASIEIETVSAFDRQKDLLTARVEGSYNDYSNDVTPKLSVDFATRLSDNFGVSGGISYYQRKFETDNIEADDWEQLDGAPFATEVQYRDYDVERERISATLGFDVRASDSTELYLKGVWSQFDDQEFRRRLTFDLGDFDEGPVLQDGPVATFSDADQEFTVERDIKDRFERQRIRTIVLGGETEANGWFAEYSASWAKSSERENGSVDPTQFERDFGPEEGPGDTPSGLTVAFDYSDPMVPLYFVSGATDLFSDPAGYELKDVEQTLLSDAEDEEYALKFDGGREFLAGSGLLTVQAGAKARWREKTYDKDVRFYELDGYTLADVLGAPTYRIIGIDPMPDATAPTRYFENNFDQFELQEIDSAFDSAVEDYAIDEDIFAGYLMGRYEAGGLTAIAGVRYERTKNDIVGSTAALFEEGATLPDDSIAEDDTVIVTPLVFDKSYGDWLPSVNLKYEAGDDLVLRLAGYRSLVRPKLSKLAPRFAVEVNDEDEVEGEFGNPALRPYKAWNFDASVEYYMSSNGALSAAFFYKDIEDFIVDASVEDNSFNGIAFDEAVIPINGESAEVWGIELSAAQSFASLPGLLSGFLIQANYTYTDASGTVPDGDFTDIGAVDTFRSIPLPASSKHTGNLALGYEKGPLSLRLAGTYRSKYLDELNGSAEEDRYVDDHFQLDLSAKLRLTDMVQVYYEWININDAEYFAYNRIGGQRNLYQYEIYGWTMKAGARITF